MRKNSGNPSDSCRADGEFEDKRNRTGRVQDAGGRTKAKENSFAAWGEFYKMEKDGGKGFPWTNNR